MMALTAAQEESQLRAAGWTPSAGDTVQAAWARTATPADQAAALAPTPTPQDDQQQKTQQQLAGLQAALTASSGMSQKQLDESIREFNANLDWQKQMWQNQGLPQLAIAQRAADLEQKKFEELVQQANFSQQLQTRQQDLAQQVQLGQLSIAQAQQRLADEIQHGQLAVSQGQLGLDTLKTAASLSGPENWVASANYNRGVANSTLPVFVGDLLSGRSTANSSGPATGAAAPAPLTLQGMAGQMGVGPAVPQYVQNVAAQPVAPVTTPPAAAAQQPAQQAGFWSQNPDGTSTFTRTGGAAASSTAPGGGALDPNHMATFYAQAVQAAGSGGSTGTQPTTPTDTSTATGALSKVYAAGGQALGPQQMEGLTPTEMKMFTGGGASLGADPQAFLAQYANSRIGQKAAAPAMAA